MIKKNWQNLLSKFEHDFLHCSYKKSVITDLELSEKVKQYCAAAPSPDDKDSVSEYLYWNYVAFALDKDKNSSHFKNISACLKELSLNAINSVISGKHFKSFDSIFKDPNKSLKTLFDITSDFGTVIQDIELELDYSPLYIPAFLMHLLSASQTALDETAFGEFRSTLRGYLTERDYGAFLAKDFSEDEFNDSIFYKEITRNVAENIFNSIYTDNSLEEHSCAILGMPGDVAYSIARSYLYGINLPLDKQRARDWLSYGMSVGNPYCGLLFLLNFSDMDLLSESAKSRKVADIYLALFNIYLLCCVNNHSLDPSCFDSELEYDSNNVRFDEACLFNLLAFYISVHEELAISPDCPIVSLNFLSDSVTSVMKWSYTHSKNETFSKTVLALILTLIEAEDGDSGYIDEFLRASGVKKKFRKDGVYSFITELLGQGIREKDSYAYFVYMYAFTSLKGRLEELPKTHLKELSKLGHAKATFALGSVALDSSEAEAIKLWNKSGEQGLGFSFFNLALASLLRDDNEGAAKLAGTALDYDVVYAYYVLYKANVQSNEQLAHTYLRYAAEYMFPEAIRELNQLREAGVYNPLPFMRTFEEIEDIAKTNYTADLFLCDVFTSGSIMPVNIEMTYHYQRLAVVNGCYDLFPVYKNINKISFPPVSEDCSLFVSYRKSLNDTQSFFKSNLSDEQLAQAETVLKKSEQLVRELCKGSTDLEKDILRNLYSSNMWNRYRDCKIKLPAWALEAPVRSSVTKLLSYICSCKYTVSYRIDKSNPEFEFTKGFLSEINDLASREGIRFNALKSMLSLRAVSMPLDVKSFKKQLAVAANSGFETCILLNALNFDFVLDAESENLINIQRADSVISDPDVFITSVSQ